MDVQVGKQQFTSEQVARDTHIVEMDGLRGLAAIAVLLFHTRWITGFEPLPGSYLAVDFFFALSGFVLAMAAERWAQHNLGFVSMAWKRIARLWPTYALGTAIGVTVTVVTVALHHGGATKRILEAIPGFFYLPLPHSFNGQIFPFDGPAWSLFYELIANFAFITLLSLPLRKLAFGLIAGVSAVALVWFAAHNGGLDAGERASGAPLALARVGFSFFLGPLLYSAWHRLGRPRTAPPILLVPLVAAWAVVFATSGGVIKDLLIVASLTPLTVLLTASCRAPQILNRPAKALGELSYPLYALHIPLLSLAIIVWHRLSHQAGGPGWPVLAAPCIVIVAISWVVHHRYDKPLVKWLNRLPRTLQRP